jgi:hypothetical protein
MAQSPERDDCMNNGPATIIPATEAATHRKPGELPIDPEVKLPADVRATIAEGETAFRNQKKRRRSKSHSAHQCSGAGPTFITAVVDQGVQNRRESVLKRRPKNRAGNVDSRPGCTVCGLA